MMHLFLAERNIAAVGVIGVLLATVVPEIMLNVMPRNARRLASH